jgi:hypothetical protein
MLRRRLSNASSTKHDGKRKHKLRVGEHRRRIPLIYSMRSQG